jgi:hypothetical protein
MFVKSSDVFARASMRSRLLLLTLESNADNVGEIVAGPVNSNAERPGPVKPLQKKIILLGQTKMLQIFVESSGIVGKNFPFDLQIEALHRFEHT